MRTTKELLIMMLTAINDGKFRYGLCGLAHRLHIENFITFGEYNRLMVVIMEGRPESTYDEEWYWKPGIKKPRINWLKQQIEKL